MPTRPCRSSATTTSSRRSTPPGCRRRSSPSSSSTSTSPSASCAVGCVDICPWKCIHMVTTDGDRRGHRRRSARRRPVRPCDLHHRRRRAPAAPCASTAAPPASSSWARSATRWRPATPTSAPPPTATATGCGWGRRARGQDDGTEGPPARAGETALKGLPDAIQGSQAWNSIFRPGSIFRKGYNDSPRNRSYVVMNSVLYHLHPVKVAARGQGQLHAVPGGTGASSCSSCSRSRASS